MILKRPAKLPIHIPLTTRGYPRGGRYYWEVISQGYKYPWGFSAVEDFKYCTWPMTKAHWYNRSFHNFINVKSFSKGE